MLKQFHQNVSLEMVMTGVVLQTSASSSAVGRLSGSLTRQVAMNSLKAFDLQNGKKNQFSDIEKCTISGNFVS